MCLDYVLCNLVQYNSILYSAVRNQAFVYKRARVDFVLIQSLAAFHNISVISIN